VLNLSNLMTYLTVWNVYSYFHCGDIYKEIVKLTVGHTKLDRTAVCICLDLTNVTLSGADPSGRAV
jgi:hypothetical protein